MNRRGIWKDVVGATHPWTCYQLRPNVSVAMAIAPELFEVNAAKQCLAVIDEVMERCGFLHCSVCVRVLVGTGWASRHAHTGPQRHAIPTALRQRKRQRRLPSGGRLQLSSRTRVAVASGLSSTRSVALWRRERRDAAANSTRAARSPTLLAREPRRLLWLAGTDQQRRRGVPSQLFNTSVVDVDDFRSNFGNELKKKTQGAL